MGEAALSPLIVRCQARSGSTFLMRCLSQVGGIAVALHPPCEVRYAQYMSAAYDVLTGKADHESSSRPNFFHRDKGEEWIGRNPFNRRLSKGYHKYFGDEYLAGFRNFFDERVQGFYQLVARKNKISADFFCEKAMYINQYDAKQDPDVIFNLYPHGVRSIYLVRDPRDIFCSNRAFFHTESGPTEPQLRSAMERLKIHTDAMADSHKKNRNEGKYIVRYEDLMREPEAALAGVVDFLGLDVPSRDLKFALGFAQKAVSSSHKTSKSPTTSIGRWKTELSRDMQEHAAKCFVKYGRVFGYTTCVESISD